MDDSDRPGARSTAEHGDGEVTVVVKDARVAYTAGSAEAPADPRGRVSRAARRLLGRSSTTTVQALRGVSLVARAGESIGIVGSNGSGKSTLLRVIAGLETLTSGEVLARSRPVLLGVNAALVPHLSGVENIRIGLLALGLAPAEVRQRTADVVDLAGIGSSIYRPMKTYSSGMGSRLRFAIAASADPEVLLIDEALSTGDATFKERSDRRMTQVRENAGTVFLVSHAAKTVEEICTRAIWIHDGAVVLDGPAYETTRAYRRWAASVARGEHDRSHELLTRAAAQHGTGQPRPVDRVCGADA